MVTLALRHCLGHVVDFRGFEMADGEVASSWTGSEVRTVRSTYKPGLAIG